MGQDFVSTYEFLTIAEIPLFSQFCNYTLALGVFLDDFNGCDLTNKALSLQDEPTTGILDRVQYCKLAAAAHKLANDNSLLVPEWTQKEKYIMPHPVYAFDSEDSDFRELLKDITPSEYKIRNLFLGTGVLKRV